jgi:transketolase
MNLKIIKKSEFDRIYDSNININKKLELFADMCRFNCFVSVKKAGSGHLGSSFSAMDIVVYLYLMEMNILDVGLKSENRDIYFSSKGHDVPGLYSLFYALGFVSEIDILNLRRISGLDGHPDIRHNGIEANTGSLGMGISKGKGMAWAKAYKGNGGRVFVLTGDGEFQEGQIYESLQTTASQNINNLTVIIDRNKFQTDMLVDDVNNIESLEEKVSSFGWYVTKCNGHDFNSIQNTFELIKSINDGPKFIIADTIKGKGISFMEQPYLSENGNKMYKWHSGAPDDDHFELGINELEARLKRMTDELNLPELTYYMVEPIQKAPTISNKEYVTDAYGDALCELGESRKDLILMDADLAGDCKLKKFAKMFPDRFIENGISEQDMVSTAGGIARMGLLPIVNSFGSFLSSRANEQIYNNACENTKIIYTCHFSGLIPAGPGKSHQSVRDISLFGALPNITILQPSNSIETKMVLKYCVEDSYESCMIRLVIGPSPSVIELPDDYEFKFGTGTILKKGLDAIIFAYGPVMLHEALLAANFLENEGFSLQVVNHPWLNRFDDEWLNLILKPFYKIYILEDHSTTGGLGDYLIYRALQNGINDNVFFKKFGLEEYPEYGTPNEVLKHHKLDGLSLAKRILGRKLTNNSQKSTAYSVEAPQ